MNKNISFMTVVALIAVSWLLVGCGITPKPFDYEPVSEMSKSPGVLTGESGEYTIYDSKQQKTDTRSYSGTITPANSEEFRRFQQWQQEKEEFEAFQEWKRSNQGSEAYDEFLDWKRWQSFKRWQESQPKSD